MFKNILSYIIYIVCLLHVSAILVTILREVHYKNYLIQCTNVRCRRQTMPIMQDKTLLKVYMHLLVSLPQRINLMPGRGLFRNEKWRSLFRRH